MLAYSSVAHAGYMLIGLATAPELAHQSAAIGGGEAVVFYLVSYGAMTVGAFAVLAYLSTPHAPIETVDDLAGVSRSHPGVALMMALFLFSLIGMPLTAGFFGKFFLFLGALEVRPEQQRLLRPSAPGTTCGSSRPCTCARRSGPSTSRMPGRAWRRSGSALR
jgi:NADH:ubiquinone oxidoreductase subunit 2 (subunit N)